MSLRGTVPVPDAVPVADVLPIDTADRIAAAYQRRPPRFPALPETTGLAIVLLVNRCPSPRPTLCQATAGAAEQIDDAVCVTAEAFAAVLTGTRLTAHAAVRSRRDAAGPEIEQSS